MFNFLAHLKIQSLILNCIYYAYCIFGSKGVLTGIEKYANEVN